MGFRMECCRILAVCFIEFCSRFGDSLGVCRGPGSGLLHNTTTGVSRPKGVGNHIGNKLSFFLAFTDPGVDIAGA